MKTKYRIIIALIIITVLSIAIIKANAQDKRFTAFGYTELADKDTHTNAFDYGFNLGAGIEYQMTLMYFKAEVFWFPGLNNIDYFDYKGTLGFNKHFGFNDTFRAYTGFKIGLIQRDWQCNHPMYGGELG